MDEDYEIIPKQEIEALKREIEEIKRNPLKNTPTDLLSGIVQLDASIRMLIDVFKDAEKHLKDEDAPQNNEVIKRIEKIEEQNKEIASALVTFAENMGHLQDEMKSLEKTVRSLKELVPKNDDHEKIGAFWKQQKPREKPQPLFETSEKQENSKPEQQPSMPPPPSFPSPDHSMNAQSPMPISAQGSHQGPAPSQGVPPPPPFAAKTKQNAPLQGMPPPPPGFHNPPIPPGFENSLGTIAKKRLFQQQEQQALKPNIPPGMPPPPPTKK